MVTKIVWKRNKEGGQKIGNKQVIKKVDKKTFNKYVKKFSKTKSFEEDKKRFGVTYISLINKQENKNWRPMAIRKKKSVLMPNTTNEKKFSMIVKSFESARAKKWRRTADSD